MGTGDTIKGFVTATCLLAGLFVYGQQDPAFRYEMEGISENDSYLLTLKDGYYTNGLFFKLHRLSKPSASFLDKNTIKLIDHYELGQMIYNPQRYTSFREGNVDRPYAGYLYLKFSQMRFTQAGNILQLGASVGTIGRASLGEAVQKLVHRMFRFKRLYGWDTQVRNEPGINLHGTFARPILKRESLSNLADLTPMATLNLGTSFTNASVSTLLRFGLIERPDQSAFWYSRLHGEAPTYDHPVELYLFIKPSLKYQLYNATFQGGLFRQNKGEILAEPERLQTQLNIGLHLAFSRLSAGFSYVYSSREARSMIDDERYGIINLAYRFR